MILHPDGRLEGTPEELIAYQQKSSKPVQNPTGVYPDTWTTPPWKPGSGSTTNKDIVSWNEIIFWN